MSKTQNPRALDRDEAQMVEQSKALTDHGPAELRDLIGRLRARRDRVQRQIRSRVRDGRDGPDTGARDKKAILTEAIARVADEMAARKDSRSAAANLRKAVAHKAETPRWTGPEDRTANTGPAETPNTKIAPSGALHAEGMRAAIARATGAR
ncbi:MULTISPECIES: hypothetical protein [unclassified Brevundimonas]|uniref:hypothetical protein n=1 Tax=unclassified Brevundimonas TaxID=2622653 RepID=UPI000E8930FC|nr:MULTISPECIES: hypothetical protein [unclassified Brevundimonas]HBI19756.1 hypothetical protein [Brevundimonas sp.]